MLTVYISKLYPHFLSYDPKLLLNKYVYAKVSDIANCLNACKDVQVSIISQSTQSSMRFVIIHIKEMLAKDC